MSKPNLWKHKKYPKRDFVGGYNKVKGERIFELALVPSERYPNQRNTIRFESHEAAKQAGWTKK